MAGVHVSARLTAVAALTIGALSAGACAKLHARTIGPPLDAPAPPPRIVPVAVAPIESQPIVASPPVGDVPAPPPSDRIPERQPRVRRVRDQDVQAVPGAPPRVVPVAVAPIESQPIVASPPVGDVPAPPPSDRIPERAAAPRQERPERPGPPPAEPAPVARPAPDPPERTALQTTANPAAAEQRTRAALASATRDLGRIDARALGTDARAQYDIARRFVAQASDALNKKNFEFAQQLADKAATLAALLQKR